MLAAYQRRGDTNDTTNFACAPQGAARLEAEAQAELNFALREH